MNTKIKFPSVIMGCSQAGGAPFWQNINEQEAIDTIQTAYEYGITMFDTAPMYGNGQSEYILGRAIKAFRDKVIIATKVSPDSLSYEKVIASCDESLQRLQTDYIDLLQMHFPSGAMGSPIIPIQETLGAFNELIKQGKIRAIGVSNFSLSELMEATKYAKIATVQPPYSLFWQHIGQELTPFCVERGINILAYAPLAQGLLTGRYTDKNFVPNDEFRSKQILCQPKNYKNVQLALEALKPIAKRNNLTLAQLAILWLIAQAKTSAIVGARTNQQVTENASCLTLKLSNLDIKEINEAANIVLSTLEKHDLIWNF